MCQVVFSFLILLDTAQSKIRLRPQSQILNREYLQRAADAAATPQHIFNKISLETETRTDLMALNQLHSKIDTTTSEEREAETGNVDGRPVLHIRIFAEAVVCLAEGDARAAAGEQCC
jgi:hypothetical protein